MEKVSVAMRRPFRKMPSEPESTIWLFASFLSVAPAMSGSASAPAIAPMIILENRTSLLLAGNPVTPPQPIGNLTHDLLDGPPARLHPHASLQISRTTRLVKPAKLLFFPAQR